MVRILELLLTFIPHTHVNRSSKINVKQVRLVATRKPATDEESWSIVGLAKHHLSVILSPQTPSFLLTKVVLELDEHDVFGAEHLGLAITDGKLLWPIGGELK